MPLLGQGAMTLWFDIADSAHAEHDHWHTHEHFAERLGIPGFLRASRWAVNGPGPAYFVLYETESPEVLSGPDYRARLDNPSPWTRSLMPHYRGMVRGLTRVTASVGAGVAGSLLTVRLAPDPARAAALDAWLAGEILPRLARQPGLAGAHLLTRAIEPEMTAEQAIRGRDTTVDRVLLITGYDEAAVGEVAGNVLGNAALEAHGAAHGRITAGYRLSLSATRDEAVTL